MCLQELNVKLSKMSKQLEALQAALHANNTKSADGTTQSASSPNGQHPAESDDEKTEAEREERFGDDS